MKTMRQFTMKYRVSNDEDTMIIMAEDKFSAITKFFINAQGWVDYELLSVEAGEGEYDAQTMIPVDESLDKEANKILKQSTGSGKYYAYSFDESRRIQKCIDEDIPVGRVALYPTESDEIPEGGWLVYQPWGMGGSCDSKKYNSYREAVEDFLDAQYTDWYERVNDL